MCLPSTSRHHVTKLSQSGNSHAGAGQPYSSVQQTMIESCWQEKHWLSPLKSNSTCSISCRFVVQVQFAELLLISYGFLMTWLLFNSCHANPTFFVLQHFRWWNVFDNVDGPLIFWRIWRKSVYYWRKYAPKMILTFSFAIPVACRPQICFPSYSCPGSYLNTCEFSNAFLIRENQTDGRTDGQTDGAQRLMRSLGGLHNNRVTSRLDRLSSYTALYSNNFNRSR